MIDPVDARSRRATVALIMANYNHAKYLHTSLGGLCGQTRPAEEVIVVDDGSTDDSVEIIEECAARNSNLHLIRNEKNRGVLHSIKRALETCNSDYIALLAADDKIFPGFVEKTMRLLEKYPAAGLCFSAYAVMDPKTEAIHDYSTDPASQGAFELQRYLEFMSPADNRIQLRGGIIWMSSNTVVLRKSAFLEAGGLMPRLRWHSDWFVNTVVALRYGACVVPEVLSAIRARGESSFSDQAFSNACAQRRVIRKVVHTVYRPKYWDVGLAFFRYPVLLTPLAEEVGPALLGTPAGWPFLPRYAIYCMNASIRFRTDNSFPVRLLRRLSAQNEVQPLAPVPDPTVSVIMANYNHAHYLRQSLTALCTQTRPPDELIVVDDGSTDESLQTLREFQERFSFVRILRNERNQGQLFSINRALKEARGSYINWAAADDCVAPTFLEKALACIARHPSVGICQTEYCLFYEDGGPFVPQRNTANVFNFRRMPEFMSRWRYREWLKDEIVWLSTNGALVRRDALLEMGAYHSEMQWHADWFSAQVAALRYGICLVPETLAALRVRSSSYSTDGMRNLKKQERVLNAIFKVLGEPGFRDIRRDFHKYSRVISPLGPFVYSYLARHPSRWPYLIRHLSWRFWRILSHNWSIRAAIIVSRYGWIQLFKMTFLRTLLMVRSALRVVMLPLSVALQPVRPHYQKVMNWVENRTPGLPKLALRWLRRQISSLFSRHP
jgi:glycosyltransferase involved in cell wall biosynthesis